MEILFFNQEENMIRLIRPLFLNIVKIVKNTMTGDQEGNAIFLDLKFHKKYDFTADIELFFLPDRRLAFRS
jgi:hypothetical protein